MQRTVRSLSYYGLVSEILRAVEHKLYYVGHLENKERLRIQPAQLFNFS